MAKKKVEQTEVCPEFTGSNPNNLLRQIFVVKLGWVLTGLVSQDEGSTLHIVHAAVIRHWGTTKGLGELAALGPRKETILEACGHVIIEKQALLFRIDCEEKSWNK